MNPQPLSTENATGLKFILRALHYKNYRLFFFGQGVSLTGSWIQMIAMGWLVYRMTNSAFLLGAVAFMSQIPVFIFSPFAGVLADRLNRKSILIITQALAMIEAFTLAVLVFLGIVQVWHIIVLSIFIGMVNAFDAPVRQVFVSDMVDNRKDLANAIALNSFLFNGARLVGSSLAGIIIAVAGEGTCFFINGVSFLAVIWALVAMKTNQVKLKSKKHILYDLKDGLVYAFNFLPIRHILLLVSLISVMGMSYVVLMPIFAKDILRGGPDTLALLMGSTGLGALAGAVFLASRKTAEGLEKIIPIAASIFGFGLIVFSFSGVLWLSVVSMLAVGFGMMIQIASSNTLLQHLSHDDKRGRVISLYVIAFLGMAPFGSLLAGTLAANIGAPSALLISGFSCIIGSFIFKNRFPSIRIKL
ncbi:MAG: MFS transporter [Candidatus Omnitrophica bacterium]|nr:MFS transporter [Candidatus Omnitrophota bacterium]